MLLALVVLQLLLLLLEQHVGHKVREEAWRRRCSRIRVRVLVRDLCELDRRRRLLLQRRLRLAGGERRAHLRRPLAESD